MFKDRIEKTNHCKKNLKKNRCQIRLTFQNRDPGHKTGIIPSKK
jgi:hypothetical protein